MTGIVVSDFFLVRKGEYHLSDLYTGNSSSAYWYTHGFNWRGLFAWLMGLWPVLPGFARAIKGTSSANGWDHLYDITYFYGFVVAMLVYWACHAIFPVPRQTGWSPFALPSPVVFENVGESSTSESIDVTPAKMGV